MSALASYRFLKMNGLGNEIVVVDMRAAPVVITTADVRIAAGAVHFDQLMVLYPGRVPETDAFVRIYNNDGSEGRLWQRHALRRRHSVPGNREPC